MFLTKNFHNLIQHPQQALAVGAGWRLLDVYTIPHVSCEALGSP